MSHVDDDAEPPTERKGVTEDDIVADFSSRYAQVLCPVHGQPPSFSLDEKGGLIEAFCCESLAQIFLELRRGEDSSEAEPS